MNNEIKNTKGFTLIEVITVVVIVALLAGVVIPMIIKYMRSGKDEYNLHLEGQLELVGKDYYASNNTKLPAKDKISQVWLPYLKTNNYTSEEFKDADGGDCTKSYVRVINKNGEYEYIACLNCENYQTKNDAYCILDDSFINNGEEVPELTEPLTCKMNFGNYKAGAWTNTNVEANFTATTDPLTSIKII